jgi:hypothetical protein
MIWYPKEQQKVARHVTSTMCAPSMPEAPVTTTFNPELPPAACDAEVRDAIGRLNKRWRKKRSRRLFEDARDMPFAAAAGAAAWPGGKGILR